MVEGDFILYHMKMRTNFLAISRAPGSVILTQIAKDLQTTTPSSFPGYFPLFSDQYQHFHCHRSFSGMGQTGRFAGKIILDAILPLPGNSSG